MNGPLDGVRVLDFSAVVSGPLAAQILADQGASVVKIEPPGIGDISRMLGHRVGTISAMYAACNRGKRSVVLDLQTPEGVEVALELAQQCDVVVQNWRPGVADRLGLGPDALHALNPRLVVASISGVGPDGPYADWRVYDQIVQALVGVASIQKRTADAEPDLIRTLICDKSAAMFAAQAITAALFARERGAGGQVIDLSLLDATLYWLWADVFTAHTFTGAKAVPGLSIPRSYRLQPTADGHVVYVAGSDREYHGLVRALDKPEWWDEPRFSDITIRQHADTLPVISKLVDAEFRTFATADIVERLRQNQVPSAPVQSLDNALADAQVLHNAIVDEFDHPTAGPMRLPRPPVEFSQTAADFVIDIDALGASTDEVLLDHGISFERLRSLRAEGIIFG